MKRQLVNLPESMISKIKKLKESDKNKTLYETYRYLLELGIQKHNEISGKDKIDHIRYFAEYTFKNEIYSRKMLELMCEKTGIESELPKVYSEAVLMKFKEDLGINA